MKVQFIRGVSRCQSTAQREIHGAAAEFPAEFIREHFMQSSYEWTERTSAASRQNSGR